MTQLGTLAAIADDYTGATDVAVAFRRAGLRTVLYFGVPSGSGELPVHDAVVIALKSRTLPKHEATSQSLEALTWLKRSGADQFYFKYCSTFDSTPAGNIGPVLDVLCDALDVPVVLTTPSSPEHLRTVYQGQLFVDHLLLADSHMSRHPLTPMTDSYIPRVLKQQTSHRVESLPLSLVRQGSSRVREELAAAGEHGIRYVVADAVVAEDLLPLGRAVVDARLVAGAAGLGQALAEARAAKLRVAGLTPVEQPVTDPIGHVPTAILAGSCSARTLEQIEAFESTGQPRYRLDVLADPSPASLAHDALAWFDTLPLGSVPLIYSSLAPDELRQVQQALGVQRSADLLESAIGQVAVGLRSRGVRRIVSAGGETSGAVVGALGIDGVIIGAEAGHGVPWIYSTGEDSVALLLKSGNFGDVDFLVSAAKSITVDEQESVE